MKNKITAAIIDDESLARQLIKKYLSYHTNIEVISECSNGFDAIKNINEEKPDLIFLDIQMPKINGFEVNAVDYLLKPFSQERFDEALTKAFRYLENKPLQENKLSALVKLNDQRKDFLERIVVKDGQNISIIPLEKIRWIEAQDDYVMIHTHQKKYLKQKTMKYFEEHLNPKDFIRIHRSFIAAVKEVKKIEPVEKESYQIVLEDKITLPLSRTGYSKLKDFFK